MLSSDQNVATIGQLVESIRNYIELHKEYLKLDVIDKVVRLITALTLAIVLIILGISFLFYLSFSFVYSLESVIGLAWAFLLVALLFLTLLVIVFVFRKPLIERPLVRFLTGILLN